MSPSFHWVYACREFALCSSYSHHRSWIACMRGNRPILLCGLVAVRGREGSRDRSRWTYRPGADARLHLITAGLMRPYYMHCYRIIMKHIGTPYTMPIHKLSAEEQLDSGECRAESRYFAACWRRRDKVLSVRLTCITSEHNNDIRSQVCFVANITS
jgi:hypothetical protein